ncbi:MAG: DUF4350 domain-containing protein [Pseudomonadota bacterium]
MEKFKSLLILLAVLAFVIAALYAIRDHRWRWDATNNARNTLNETTRNLLGQLPGPLHVTAYTTPQDAELGDIRKIIVDFIAPYQHEKPDLTLDIVDPRENPQQAQAENIRANGEMVLAYNGRKEHLLALNEQAVANALMRLARTREHWIMFLTGHGERRADGIANHDLGDFGRQLQSKGFNILPLNLAAAQSVPANASFVVIASPQIDVPPAEVEKIKHYLEHGGNLLWLIDQEPLHGLQPLSEYLSLLLTPGTIVDPAATDLRSAATMAIASAYANHAITQDFNLNTLFPFSRRIAVNDNQEWHVTPLVEVAQRGWVETDALENGKIAFDKQRDTPGPVTVAVTLERNIGDKEQRIVVVGSGHFLANTYLGNGGNLDLGINMANWLAGDDAFISVQPRPTLDHSLNLGRRAQTAIVWGHLILLPAAFLLIGAVAWWRRRRA